MVVGGVATGVIAESSFWQDENNIQIVIRTMNDLIVKVE
jgi:hypothetical protein